MTEFSNQVMIGQKEGRKKLKDSIVDKEKGINLFKVVKVLKSEEVGRVELHEVVLIVDTYLY